MTQKEKPAAANSGPGPGRRLLYCLHADYTRRVELCQQAVLT